MNVNRVVQQNENGSSCICNNPLYDYQSHFDIAMGKDTRMYIGMCCCRAKGLICVLQMLGLGDYVKGYANYETPSTLRPQKHYCNKCGQFFRFFGFGGGIFNNFQGTAYKSGNEYGVHYSPQGPHIAPYHEIIDAPVHVPGNLSRPVNTLNAFQYYRWNEDPDTIVKRIDFCPNVDPHNLPLLSKPGL